MAPVLSRNPVFTTVIGFRSPASGSAMRSRPVEVSSRIAAFRKVKEAVTIRQEFRITVSGLFLGWIDLGQRGSATASRRHTLQPSGAAEQDHTISVPRSCWRHSAGCYVAQGEGRASSDIDSFELTAWSECSE